MNNREGKKDRGRGKKGMKTKEGMEEPWKRGKAKPEKRAKGLHCSSLSFLFSFITN